ncbi:MAG: hypothetical protein RL330_1113 [Actinomycetota bacterium]|jgi:hypothetical protein
MSVHFEGDVLYATVPTTAAPVVHVLDPAVPRVTVAAGGLQGPYGPGLPMIFGFSGPLSPRTGRHKYPFYFATTLTGVTVTLNEAPVGAPVVLAILVNGVEEETVTIPDGVDYLSLVPISVPVGIDDYVTMNVVSVGSSSPGADMTASIRYD